MKRLIFILTFLSLGIAGTAQAGVGAKQLRRAVTDFLAGKRAELLANYTAGTRLEYRINPLDSRLQLADCDQPLALDVKDLSPVGNRLNVHVRCPGSARWALYVPVTLAIWQPVVVVKRPLARGAVISAADLELEEQDVATLNSPYFSSIQEAAGSVARRPLAAGSPLLASQIEAPLLVQRGQTVVLSARQGTLQVKMNGVAESDGRRGDRISVRNSQSQRLIEGRVTGPGQVEVTL